LNISGEKQSHLAEEMQTALTLVDECIDQMELCCGLQRDLLRLTEQEEKNEHTKIMLMLANYGSKTGFLEKICESTTEYNKRLDNLESFVKEIEEELSLNEYPCPECYGTGTHSKYEYERDKGIVEPILRSTPCEICHGKGTLSMPEGAKVFLSPFLEMCKRIIRSQQAIRATLNVFNIRI
jgi:hypothetical protein